MKTTNKLIDILNKELKWDKRRMECFVQMLLSIMIVQTVNLTKLANQTCTKTKAANRYRRLQRFFEKFKIDYDEIAKFIFRLFDLTDQKLYLSLDRTNWKWGKKNINILLLSIVYREISIPIYWLILNKRGNSSTLERKALIKRFIKVFGKDCIECLLADREFIGKDWFGWLDDENIPFIIRIRKNINTKNRNGKDIDVSWLFHNIKPGEKLPLKRTRKILGCNLFVTGGKSSKGELLIVVSNIQDGNAIDKYLLRWKIEVLFQSLKSRGFNFEDTHITKRSKIKKLTVLLAISFCWAYKTGEWRCINERRIKLKKHGRKEKSVFIDMVLICFIMLSLLHQKQ